MHLGPSVYRITNTKFWPRFWLCVLLGALTSLALPPFGFVPILFFTFPILYLFVTRAPNALQAFGLAWAYAWGMYVCSFHWIAASMFVDIARYWWAVPLAVLGLPAGFAIYYGVAGYCARRFCSGVGGPIIFALIWFLAEYARGHVFTGFPWNLAGYTWVHVLPVMQGASVVGIYGLTLLTLLAAVVPVYFTLVPKRTAVSIIGATLVCLVALYGWGQQRIADATNDVVDGVRLRLVAPHIAQEDKWSPHNQERNFAALLNLSSMPAEKAVTHVIWPETAATAALHEDYATRAIIATRIPENSTLITGVIRRDWDEGGSPLYYNSLIALDNKAAISANYDKLHLVPFGEFMPLKHYARQLGIQAIAASDADFSSGTERNLISIKGLPAFTPLICYEAIFPDEVAATGRPQFLLNITNDAWFGKTIGPMQHFEIARVRAIEQGVPLIRVANAGVTGVVDAVGRVRESLGRDEAGFLDVDLPKAQQPTFFARFGELPLWVVVCAMVIFTITLCQARRLGK